MTELKPCPLGCPKSHIKVYTRKITSEHFEAKLQCNKCDISIARSGATEKCALENAIKAWNTRAERVCKWEAVTDPNGKITEFMGECGCCMGYVPNYCPNCGAKVVE